MSALTSAAASPVPDPPTPAHTAPTALVAGGRSSGAVAAIGSRAARQSRIRSSEPPSGIEHPAVLRAQTTLAAVIDLADRRASRRAAPPGRRPSRFRATGPEGLEQPLPNPTGVSCAIVRTAVEVLRGERPAAQLARWVSPDILAAVHRRARFAATTDPVKEAPPAVAILRTRTVRLGERAAEITVVIRDRERVRAAAVRLEAARGSWHAVALEIG